ncbi:MAG: lycopene cyclase family protein [Bacteroidota bacterium]
MIHQYDHLMAGGGCAGLAMAYQLRLRLGPDARILVVDREVKDQNDRTWAFWSKNPLPLGLDQIVKHRWSNIHFGALTWNRTRSIDPYCYQLIDGSDYYKYLKQQLTQSPNTHFLQAEIACLGEDDTGPWAKIGGDLYRADWIFDSRVNAKDLSLEDSNPYFLWQHFRGWKVKTDRPCFNPNVATLMDFSQNEAGEPAFFYCLPFSATEALIEYTAFTVDIWKEEVYERQMINYLRQRFGHVGYSILEEEEGKIPMTDLDLVNRNFRRIRSIGTAGNAVKPTTGYAFLRIQEQVSAMAEELVNTGDISHAGLPNDRFRWYDHLLLYLLQHHPERSRDIFVSLFKGQPFERILRFLDEDSKWWEEVLIFKDLQVGWFLEAAWKHSLRKKPSWANQPALRKKTHYG